LLGRWLACGACKRDNPARRPHSDAHCRDPSQTAERIDHLAARRAVDPAGGFWPRRAARAARGTRGAGDCLGLLGSPRMGPAWTFRGSIAAAHPRRLTRSSWPAGSWNPISSAARRATLAGARRRNSGASRGSRQRALRTPEVSGHFIVASPTPSR